MANVQRRPTILPLVGLVCLPFAASAAQLRVIGDGGAIASTVELKTVQYDVTQKRLVATTAAGNVICSGAAAPAGGKVGLTVDGSSYGVLDDPDGSQAHPVDVNPVAGSYTLGVTGEVACRSSNTTAAGLKLAFDNGAPLTIAEAVYFDLPTRTFRIRVTEAVMCNTYASASPGLSIQLTEANGVAETISGFEQVDYELSGALLRARSLQGSGARMVECFSFAAPSGAPGASPSSGETIFGSRFEFDDVAADLVVSASPATVSLLAGGPQSFQYTLTIVNAGNAPANDVRAREYLPSVSGGGNVTAGAWTCERFAAAGNTDLGCASASGTGVVNQLNPSLAPGERLVYTLNRTVVGGSAGASLWLGGAAWVNPTPAAVDARPDRDYSNNSSRLPVNLVSNQPPAVQQPLAQNTTEDGTPVTIVYTATDPEGNAIQTPTITSSDTALFPGTLTAVSSGPNQWSVTLTPAADRNGSATITASFTDGNSLPVTITSAVSVAAVNDAPAFTLAIPNAAISVTQGSANCGASGSCIASASNFIAGAVPGPVSASDEAAQTVRPATAADVFGDLRLPAGACRAAAANGIDPATFFTDGALPRVIEPSAGSFNLVASLTRTVGAVECDITVVDTGSPAATSAPQTVTISYQLPPP
jgi:hypothetical protein